MKRAGWYALTIQPFYRKPYEHLTALDICRQIWKVYPHYRFHSYLGGTVLADSPKWLFGTHVGSGKRLYGNLGPKTAEVLQNGYHIFTGKYLSFTSPKINSKARLIFPFMLIDKGVRKLDNIPMTFRNRL